MIMFSTSTGSAFLESWSKKGRFSGEVENFAQNSYEYPEVFWKDLLDCIQAKQEKPFRSTIFQSYQFYHDCIVCHLNQNLIALKWAEGTSWREWTYDNIHSLVNYQVNRWRNQVQDWTGNVAIVMPLGINLLVGVLTAVRLGLTFSVLPLDSPLLPMKRLRHCLDQLKINMILTTPEASSTIPGDERHWLIEYLEESDKYEPETDYTYAPNDTIQLAYSCHTQNVHPLVPVTAQEMYLNALRDGYLTFGLRPGMTWGYNPDCSLREQPYLLFTSLLFGATTVILPENQMLQNPESATSLSIDVLGVSPFLRELWTKQEGLPRSRLSHWYYNIFDEDQKAWALFIKKNKLEKLTFTRLLIDNSSGGVPLTSVTVEDEERDPLWPSFGVEWDLLQYGQQEVRSVHTYGIFKQKTEYDRPSNFMLTRLREGWELATTVTPHKKGYTIPVKEVEDVAESLEFVDFAFFLILPIPHSHLNTQGVLLIFIDPHLQKQLSQQQSEWERAIKVEIEQCVGSPFIPNKIEFFPLVPRIQDKNLDRDWCYCQYTSGYLSRKKNIKAYHWLSLLKKSALRKCEKIN